MNRACVKCGSNRISGPSYSKNGWAGRYDTLVFRCLQCGYDWFTMTLDHEPPDSKARTQVTSEAAAK